MVIAEIRFFSLVSARRHSFTAFSYVMSAICIIYAISDFENALSEGVHVIIHCSKEADRSRVLVRDALWHLHSLADLCQFHDLHLLISVYFVLQSTWSFESMIKPLSALFTSPISCFWCSDVLMFWCSGTNWAPECTRHIKTPQNTRTTRWMAAYPVSRVPGNTGY